VRPVSQLALVAAVALALAAGAARADGAGPRPEVVWVSLGGETFQLELALDPLTRQRGLSGRESLPRGGGMLFVLPSPRPFGMVMRDCPAPIDVAFLDAQGRVVAIHEMRPEPPRQRGEPRALYEARLPVYPSGQPVQLAIETAGGRLAEVGLAVGDSVALDVPALVARAR
jgi:uncharacterized membrane protein (UPF0127 family)